MIVEHCLSELLGQRLARVRMVSAASRSDCERCPWVQYRPREFDCRLREFIDAATHSFYWAEGDDPEGPGQYLAGFVPVIRVDEQPSPRLRYYARGLRQSVPASYVVDERVLEPSADRRALQTELAVSHEQLRHQFTMAVAGLKVSCVTADIVMSFLYPCS